MLLRTSCLGNFERKAAHATSKKFRRVSVTFVIVLDQVRGRSHITRGCTIKINLLGFSKFLYHCFLETVRIFTVPNLSNLFGIISEFRLGAKIGDARLWEQKY